jgi:ribonuclease HII
MVIAGVKILKRDEKKLIELGVKDSKELSPKRRDELAKKIEEIAKDIVILRVQPCKIDSYRAKGINLDKIEAMKMAQIIDMLDGDKIYVDSLEQNAGKFKNLILSFLQKKDYNLVVENYLDESIPVVSAASIIAKVERDKEIEKIKRRENYDFGVGYPHDIRTINFIKKLIRERKELPNFVRKSWITTKELQKQTWQRKLRDFIFGKEKCD